MQVCFTVNVGGKFREAGVHLIEGVGLRWGFTWIKVKFEEV